MVSKNIVVFSDGTNQEGGEGNPTNIYKIFRMLENRTSDQISFYDRGLESCTPSVGQVEARNKELFSVL